MCNFGLEISILKNRLSKMHDWKKKTNKQTHTTQLTKCKKVLLAIFLNIFELSLEQLICYNGMHTEMPFLCLDGRVVIAS